MDQLMDKVGGQGLYQWYAFMVFNAHWFVLGWFLLGIGFYFEAKPFDCKAVGVDYDEAACQEFVCTLSEGDWKHFLPNPPNTMAYEWPEYWMVCSNEYIKSILQSLIALGSCIGFFIFPYYADNKGRKITMVVAWGFFTVGVVFTALANGPWMAGIGQFLMGFGGNAAITLDFSFINEQCSGKARQYFSIGVQMFFAISECLVGYVLYWMQNWRYTVYIMLGATVLVNISHYFLIETPKYMMSKDLPKTVELFNRIAKINKRPEVTYDEVLEEYEKE